MLMYIVERDQPVLMKKIMSVFPIATPMTPMVMAWSIVSTPSRMILQPRSIQTVMDFRTTMTARPMP